MKVTFLDHKHTTEFLSSDSLKLILKMIELNHYVTTKHKKSDPSVFSISFFVFVWVKTLADSEAITLKNNI